MYARHRSAPPVRTLEINGVFKSLVDSTLTLTDSHNADVSVAFTPDTIFRRGDTAITPADLKVGDRLEVRAIQKDNLLTALSVKVENDNEQEPEAVELSGSLKSVAADGSSIVMTDAAGHDVTVGITSTTFIRKGDQAATLADLAVGDRLQVKALRSGTSLNAVVINDEEKPPQQTQIAEINGSIKSVAADGSSIVVTPASGPDVTVMITDHTAIRKGDAAATVADLKSGDRVEILATVSGTTTTALLIHDEAQNEQQIEVKFQATVKTTGASQITVTFGGADVVIKTDANTRIRKDDRSIQLTDIKSGDVVSVEGTKVDDHTILARDIEVRSSGGHH